MSHKSLLLPLLPSSLLSSHHTLQSHIQFQHVFTPRVALNVILFLDYFANFIGLGMGMRPVWGLGNAVRCGGIFQVDLLGGVVLKALAFYFMYQVHFQTPKVLFAVSHVVFNLIPLHDSYEFLLQTKCNLDGALIQVKSIVEFSLVLLRMGVYGWGLGDATWLWYIDVLSLSYAVAYLVGILTIHFVFGNPQRTVPPQEPPARTTPTMIPHAFTEWMFALIHSYFSNPAFRSLLYLFSYESLRALLYSGLYTLYLLQVLQLSPSEFHFWMSCFQLARLAMSIVGVAFWTRVVQLISLRTTWLLSYALQCGIGALVYFIPTSGLLGFEPVQVYFVLSCILSFIGEGTGFILPRIKTRVFKYEELINATNGKAAVDTSHLETAWRMLPKYVSLPGSFFSYWVIQYFGFSSDSGVQQPDSAVWSIRFFATMWPALSGLGCLYLMSRFPISDKNASVIDDEVVKVTLCSDETPPIADPLTNRDLRIVSMERCHGERLLWSILRKLPLSLLSTTFAVLSVVSIVPFAQACLEFFTTLSSAQEYEFPARAAFGYWLSSVSFCLMGFFKNCDVKLRAEDKMKKE